MRIIKLCLVLACLTAIGCTGTRPVEHGVWAPADFSLAFCVKQLSAEGGTHPSCGIFIVEPDGVLRSALGAGCTLDTYPKPTAQLTPAQIQELYELVRGAGLLEPREAYSQPTQPPCFQVVVQAQGQRIRTDMPVQMQGWKLTGDDQNLPAISALLAKLFEHSGLIGR